MPQMPFTPCPSTGPCTDESVLILKRVFGPIIDALTSGADPSSVASSANVLATMFGYFNSGLLAVASIIVSYVAMMGTINTANDGEAMGKAWSSVWTPVRIVTGGAVLLPTASGYSFIQTFVLMLALWGAGFASSLYRVGMTMGIIKPDNIVSTSTIAPPSSFGLRNFAKQYLPVSYCSRAANAIYSDSMGTPLVQANEQADRVSTVDGRVEYTFYVKDRNPSTNLGGGDAICGTVKLTSYTPTGAAEATGTSAAIATLHSGLSVAKVQAATDLMTDINNWVLSMPTDLNQAGWGAVESKKFNDIVKYREDALANQITAQVASGTTQVNNGISVFISALTNGGWSTAGGWYQRAGAIRKELGSAVTESVGSASEPSLSSLPSDMRAQSLRAGVSTMAETILQKSEEPGKGYDLTANPAADIASSLPKNANSDMNIGAIQQDINSKFGSLVNTTMKKTVDIAIGSAVDVDAVSRMKLVGDYLVISLASTELAKATLKTSVATVRAMVAGAGGVQILGTKVDGSGAMTALWDWAMAVPVEQLNKLTSYLEPLAFYFSVFLPSLPSAIFVITVVGWLLGVLQTVIAAPLWAIMHMRPSQTFVGSDSQGYLLLLALFVRPALAVLGLFAAMLVADPIVDYIAKAFFSMRGAVVTSTGLFPGALVEFFTFAWWVIAFGLVLLPVLYMIYGLPQVLPDHVLKWLNVGVQDLGATSAMSNVRGGLVMSTLQGKRDGSRELGSGDPSGGGDPRLPNGPTGHGSGAGRNSPINAGQQGVVPMQDSPVSSTPTSHTPHGRANMEATTALNVGRQGVTSAASTESMGIGAATDAAPITAPAESDAPHGAGVEAATALNIGHQGITPSASSDGALSAESMGVGAATEAPAMDDDDTSSFKPQGGTARNESTIQPMTESVHSDDDSAPPALVTED